MNAERVRPEVLCYWPDQECVCPGGLHIHHTLEDYERLEAAQYPDNDDDGAPRFVADEEDSTAYPDNDDDGLERELIDRSPDA